MGVGPTIRTRARATRPGGLGLDAPAAHDRPAGRLGPGRRHARVGPGRASPRRSSAPPARSTRLPVRPHPIFLGLCAAFAACGVLAAKEVGNPRVWVFGFVALGWVISLCLHEFAHAAVAWKGGDRSVEGRGYLTLNPARYMNSQMSIVLPILIVLIGGIALPGGAVIVDRRFVRDASHAEPDLGRRPAHQPRVRPRVRPADRLRPRPRQRSDALGSPGGTGRRVPGGARLPRAARGHRHDPQPAADPRLRRLRVIAPYLKDETVQSLMPISRFAWFGLFIVLFYSAAGRAGVLERRRPRGHADRRPDPPGHRRPVPVHLLAEALLISARSSAASAGRAARSPSPDGGPPS